MNFYNEHDPFAAQWIRQLMADGHIPEGVVDERSIEDIVPAELAGFVQCHFFAGVTGWPLALKQAGWPEDRPVWTGSCPCQPFSSAGKGDGLADERHLWPQFHHLISQCRPGVVFGEQVASPDGLDWLDLVQSDLEGEDYAFGALDLCAAGFRAPHIRQRLFWVANSIQPRLEGQCRDGNERGEPGRIRPEASGSTSSRRQPCGLAHPHGDGREQGLWDDQGARHGDPVAATGSDDRLGFPRPNDSFWGVVDWLFCRDGKWRPVERGTYPLAFRIPARMGLLRGYGNAICIPVAKAFIEAYLTECDSKLNP